MALFGFFCSPLYCPSFFDGNFAPAESFVQSSHGALWLHGQVCFDGKGVENNDEFSILLALASGIFLANSNHWQYLLVNMSVESSLCT